MFHILFGKIQNIQQKQIHQEQNQQKPHKEQLLPNINLTYTNNEKKH